MSDGSIFLSDLRPRSWAPEEASGLQQHGQLFIGKGASGIEVAIATATTSPNRSGVIGTWKARRGNRAAPLLLVVVHQQEAILCGATGEVPPVYPPIEIGIAERICREALSQPDRHCALRFLAQALPSLETEIPGLYNEGLVAFHELVWGVPKREDWSEAGKKAKKAHGQSDMSLLTTLGYRIKRLDRLTMILSGGRFRTALAVVLLESETPEAGTDRFNSLSPVSYALAKADEENLPWVIMVQGNRIRLYSTSASVGIGRRGRTETFIECQVPLLSDEHAAYLWLLFSAEALSQQGSINDILSESHRFAGSLAEKLRERIYDEVIPLLAGGISEASKIKKFTAADLEKTHEMVLMVLFRLLFIAYAEDRDLLPYRFNESYRLRSLKRKAQELAENEINAALISNSDNHWQEFMRLCRAVANGNPEWGVPAYDGGLFSEEKSESKLGAELAKLSVRDEIFERALRALLVTQAGEGVPGPVDFRSLGVREFGTIYEGLLESELAFTDIDLSRGNNGTYRPSTPGSSVEIPKNSVYLQNRSGARKLSGSYYTKSFVVEYLLDRTIEPALCDHFERVRDLDEADAAEAFFDFRVADIAMGSGHFLIAAIDRIEKRMADFLSSHSVPRVRQELATLRSAAHSELAEHADSKMIEDCQLLRRLIARNCIFGVDLNLMSVHLARLAVWIHTFVPGLPMSMLDHRLVHGNSLVGIGTIDEIKARFKETPGPLLNVDADKLLGKAAGPLRRLANINDTTPKDIKLARKLAREASENIKHTKELCDLISARSLLDDSNKYDFLFFELDDVKEDIWNDAIRSAQSALQDLYAMHFPVEFPEVFLRNRPGFDVILGNPPWEEVTVETHAFWARYFPGIRGLKQKELEKEIDSLCENHPELVPIYKKELKAKERLRKALLCGAYPGMGSGDPDLYKAFCWRFWGLAVADGGRIGVVLPRGVLAGKGSTEFRNTIIGESSGVEISTLQNKKGWVFDDVHKQYIVGLFCITRGKSRPDSVRLHGPYFTPSDLSQGEGESIMNIDAKQILSWSESAAIPLLPAGNSVDVFVQLRKSSSLDLVSPTSWRARPYRELDATQQKNLMDFKATSKSDVMWPVYKGESFELWNPDTEIYYAYANSTKVLAWLKERRERSMKNPRSPHSEFSRNHILDRSTLPCLFPRVAYRDVSNSIDSRTVHVSLIPPQVFVTNKAPYFLWPRGDELDQAFLLGILSSISLDWYARRFVGLSLNFFIVNSFPIPRLSRDSALWKRLVWLAGRLACPDERFADWAQLVGVDCGPLDDAEKEDMIHEIDAVAAHSYGLDENHLVHIFETYRENYDYQNRLDAVLRHFRSWEGSQ